jgi:hypothetical protein
MISFFLKNIIDGISTIGKYEFVNKKIGGLGTKASVN